MHACIISAAIRRLNQVGYHEIDICALANCAIVQQDYRKSKDLLTASRLLFGFVGKRFWIVVLRGSGQQQSHQM